MNFHTDLPSLPQCKTLLSRRNVPFQVKFLTDQKFAFSFTNFSFQSKKCCPPAGFVKFFFLSAMEKDTETKIGDFS